jgi:DNA (cytosine-5)-methyltransferase 1
MTTRKILVADLLCGAGGSSTGCARAMKRLGIEMELVCVNHWPTAIATHTKNHPQARHYCQDISAVRPHLIVPEGRLDLLMASPTCTHHSVARGGKPTSDQQRSDPWHIITWLTELRVKRMILENVWEWTKWGPVDEFTGKPIKEREGEYFRAYIDTVWRLGATSIEWRKLNSADFGAATTRQRFYGFFRFDGKPLLWPVATHAKLPANDDLKRWKAARYIIDWSIKGRSIFGRPVPLAPKTLARILAGARKFGWPEIFITMLIAEMDRSLLYAIRYAFLRRHAKKADVRKRCRARVPEYIAWLRVLRAVPQSVVAAGEGRSAPMLVTLRNHADGRSVDLPVPAVAANGTHIGLAEPIIVNMKGQSKAGSVDSPLPTQTSHAAHIYVADPVIINGRKGNKAKAVSIAPVPTLDTKGGIWLAEPFILNRHGEGYGETRAHSTNAPLPAADCRGAGYLIEPFILAPGSTGAPREVKEPLPTITTGGSGSGEHVGCARPMLIEPFVLSQASGGSPRETTDPLPTAVAGGAIALISPYYGSGSGETCTSVDDPLPTATSNDRFALVVPITHSDGSNRARDVAIDPLPTLTTAHRGELAFITAQFGEREGQAPRVHDIDNPAPAICATGHVNLVQAFRHDILFRMLEPHELAAAMGFNNDEIPYEFVGNKTEQVKQIGNAVQVDQMEANVYAMMQDEVEAPPQFLEAAE